MSDVDALLADRDYPLPAKLRAAWRRYGLLVLRANDKRLLDHERAMLATVGARLYGDRTST